MAKDKDPILDEKFFELLFPIIYPTHYNDPVIRCFCKNHLMLGDRLLSSGKLLEAAISKAKNLERHDTMGKDFVDGSDAKSSSARWSSNNTKYSANISDVANKKGLLRCVVYERQLDKFYYFLIPYSAYNHITKSSNIEINFNLDGTPKKNPGKNTIVNWWDFEVIDFNGILNDNELPYTNYRNIRKKKKEEELSKKLAKAEAQQKKKAEREARISLRKLKKSLLGLDFFEQSKTDPTPQTSSLYIGESVQSEILNSEETQPTSLCD